MNKIISGALTFAALQGVCAAQQNAPAPAPPVRGIAPALALKKQARLAEFRRTPLFAKRQQMYAKAWTAPTTTLRYSNGHSVTVKMVKNPSSAEGAANVTKNVKLISQKPSPDHQGWVCSTQSVSLNATSSTFLNNDYSNANSHIYPGAIFTFENFYKGAYREQAGTRHPMEIVTDNPNINGSSGVLVANPGEVSCRDAVASIFHRFTGAAGNESLAYDAYSSYNSADLNLQISGGASAYGISFSDAFSSDSSSNSVSMTVDARKTLYSISALPPDNGFFADPNIESTPDLMVVSNVVYGVRVLANLNITFNSLKDENDFKAAYSGGLINANVAMNYINSHQSTVSTIHGYVVGGAGSSSVTWDASGFQKGIDQALSGATYQNARPISYQFMDMAGDIVGTQSATDTFTVQTCAPSAASADPQVTSIRAAFQQGADGKDFDTLLNVYLYAPNYMPGNRETPNALFGYQSGQHSTRFENDGTASVFLTSAPYNHQTFTYNSFLKANGGHIRVHIYPNGHDTWQVASMDLIIGFSDGTSKDIHFNGFTVSQDAPIQDLFFDGSFTQK